MCCVEYNKGDDEVEMVEKTEEVKLKIIVYSH